MKSHKKDVEKKRTRYTERKWESERKRVVEKGEKREEREKGEEGEEGERREKGERDGIERGERERE